MTYKLKTAAFDSRGTGPGVVWLVCSRHWLIDSRSLKTTIENREVCVFWKLPWCEADCSNVKLRHLSAIIASNQNLGCAPQKRLCVFSCSPALCVLPTHHLAEWFFTRGGEGVATEGLWGSGNVCLCLLTVCLCLLCCSPPKICNWLSSPWNKSCWRFINANTLHDAHTLSKTLQYIFLFTKFNSV